jgi:hypothetical protein
MDKSRNPEILTWPINEPFPDALSAMWIGLYCDPPKGIEICEGAGKEIGGALLQEFGPAVNTLRNRAGRVLKKNL